MRATLQLLGHHDLILGLLLKIVQCRSHWEQITGVFNWLHLWRWISTLAEMVIVVCVVLGLFLRTIQRFRFNMVNVDSRNTQGWRERRWRSEKHGLSGLSWVWLSLDLRILKSRDDSMLVWGRSGKLKLRLRKPDPGVPDPKQLTSTWGRWWNEGANLARSHQYYLDRNWSLLMRQKGFEACPCQYLCITGPKWVYLRSKI